MLSTHQLERMLETGDSNRLVKRVLANGRCSAPGVVAALTDEAVLPIVAPALALQRLCELTYGRCTIVDRVAAQLIRRLEMNPPDAPAAQAVAARALMIRQSRAEQHPMAQRAAAALDQLLASLAERQDDSGLIDGDPHISAIVAWQLGDRGQNCAPLETQALQRALLGPGQTNRRSDVFGFARAVAA